MANVQTPLNLVFLIYSSAIEYKYCTVLYKRTYQNLQHRDNDEQAEGLKK